jgi:predicted acyltransferase
VPDRSQLSAPSCRVGILGRLVRGCVSVVLAALTVVLLPTAPLIAVAAGVFAGLVAVMAITGWCPADGLASRGRQKMPRNTLGFPEAHPYLDPSRPATERPRQPFLQSGAQLGRAK